MYFQKEFDVADADNDKRRYNSNQDIEYCVAVVS